MTAQGVERLADVGVFRRRDDRDLFDGRRHGWWRRQAEARPRRRLLDAARQKSGRRRRCCVEAPADGRAGQRLAIRQGRHARRRGRFRLPDGVEPRDFGRDDFSRAGPVLGAALIKALAAPVRDLWGSAAVHSTGIVARHGAHPQSVGNGAEF
ncbi:unnamed protein product [Pelagomonas calceolata]|uniref:Uncharacterized protein n=1 Tax=Pelagomonas calceolata TaxID=35677 RepID=A0A8J2X585_9STRA|nr:unnamed protein product [Pelagomonas calceolata]